MENKFILPLICLLFLGQNVFAQVNYHNVDQKQIGKNSQNEIIVDLDYPVFEGDAEATILNEWVNLRVKQVSSNCSGKRKIPDNKPIFDAEEFSLDINVLYNSPRCVILESWQSHDVAPPEHGGESTVECVVYDREKGTFLHEFELIKPSMMDSLRRVFSRMILKEPNRFYNYSPQDDLYSMQLAFTGYELVKYTMVFICMDETTYEPVKLELSEARPFLSARLLYLIE